MEDDFLKMQAEAAERMREYKKRANISSDMPPVPNFVKVNRNGNRGGSTAPRFETEEKTPFNEVKKSLDNFKNLMPPDLDFLDGFLGQKDTTLILGLLLVLWGEKSDKLLLFALLYILM